jgi:hypothetical protein
VVTTTPIISQINLKIKIGEEKMNKKIFKVRYTVDRQTFKAIEIVANDRADAYVTLKTHVPNAEIVSIICLSDSWVKAVAKYLADNASVKDIKALCDNLSDDQQDALIDALHTYNKKGENV